MNVLNKQPENHIYHCYGLYYLTSLIPISLIYSAAIIFYRNNNYFPYFEELGFGILEKRFIEVGFNMCAWIMLPTFLFTDGVIQIFNKKNKSNEKDKKNARDNYKLYRFLTGASATLAFLSCIAYGSIIISEFLKYFYICEVTFLISATIYFLLINFMFDIVQINKKEQASSCKKSNIGLLDWIHAFSGLLLFSFSYLLKNNFVQNNDISVCISKALQYLGISLLFLNFIRIHLRMPRINFFLTYQKKC